MMPSNNKLSSRPSFVSPPPSVGRTGGSTELDAALAHLRPTFKRLLPNLSVKTTPQSPKTK